MIHTAGHLGRTRRYLAILAAALAVAVGCSEAEPTEDADSTDDGTADAEIDGAMTSLPGDGSVVSRYAGADWFMGTIPETATAADESLDPVRIGLVNTDSGPIAATPELHQATDAAVAFINAELGGVDGHPVEIVACETDLSPESAQACGRKMVDEGVPAVLGGITISSDTLVTVLEENGIGFIGGIPINDKEMTSDSSIQFSGGSPGSFAAFADHAANTVAAETASVLYTNLPQIADPAQDYLVTLLEDFGVEVTEVPFDISTQDFATIATKAAEGDPDVIVAAAADSACPKIMEALDAVGSDATIYMVGTCADPKWLDQVPTEASEGTIFSIESRIDQTDDADADNEIYEAVMNQYGVDVNAEGAGTLAFRSTMNLYAILDELGTDGIDAESILDAFHDKVDQPNFDGHPYTCDGTPIPELPSLCSPQAVLVTLTGPDGTDFVEVSDGWVDVPAILAGR